MLSHDNMRILLKDMKEKYGSHVRNIMLKLLFDLNDNFKEEELYSGKAFHKMNKIINLFYLRLRK
jgi:hypothetical protein